MIGVLKLLRDIVEKKVEYRFVDDGRLLGSALAVSKGSHVSCKRSL
jgi:ribosomal protein L7Ae-like RNA K-turn-binding protein